MLTTTMFPLGGSYVSGSGSAASVDTGTYISANVIRRIGTFSGVALCGKLGTFTAVADTPMRRTRDTARRIASVRV